MNFKHGIIDAMSVIMIIPNLMQVYRIHTHTYCIYIYIYTICMWLFNNHLYKLYYLFNVCIYLKRFLNKLFVLTKRTAISLANIFITI